MGERLPLVALLKWRLVALLLNATAVGSFALIAVTSDRVYQPFFLILGQQFDAMMQFYAGIASFVVVVGGFIAIATMLVELAHWRFSSRNTALRISINSLFFFNLVIGVENIVANLIPMIFIILLNAVVWALLILFMILMVSIIGVIIFNFLFSGRERSKSSYRTKSAKPSYAASDAMKRDAARKRSIEDTRKMFDEYYDARDRDRERRAGWP